MNKKITEKITKFQRISIPGNSQAVGYSALIEHFLLKVPIPQTLCAIGVHHTLKVLNNWKLFTPRHEPESSLKGHLVFALKYEGIDLCILHELFTAIKSEHLLEAILSAPTSQYMRRIWFLFEWITEETLPISDLSIGNYIEVLNSKQQWGIKGERVSRQRVVNNLPGTNKFCPLVFKNNKISQFIQMDLKKRAIESMGKIPKDILLRTAAFLLLKDSRASFDIENEVPPMKRVERWGKVIGEAGRLELSIEELLRLQKIVIGNSRFITLGFRKEGGFIGEHDRETGTPIPEHISAKPEDLQSLITGVIDFNKRAQNSLDPVITAACLAFGFVYIHPFVDGNGRIHRYIFHHTLAELGYNPLELIFPISSAIYERMDAYRDVLVTYSRKLLPLIEWEQTRDNNVLVNNTTDAFYRFFDATKHVEFLFECVQSTLENDLPREIAFLNNYDRFKREINEIVDMPNNMIDLLYRFLSQNQGNLSKRARKREFLKLDDKEIVIIEELFNEIFNSIS